MNKLNLFFEKKTIAAIGLSFVVLCVIGGFIHRLRITQYFPNIPNMELNLKTYFFTAILWLLHLAIIYAVFYFLGQKSWKNKYVALKWKMLLMYFVYAIIGILVINTIRSIIYQKNLYLNYIPEYFFLMILLITVKLYLQNDRRICSEPPLWRKIIRYVIGLFLVLYIIYSLYFLRQGVGGLFPFTHLIVIASWRHHIPFVINPKLNLLLSLYCIMFFISGIIIVNSLLKKQKLSVLIIACCFNIIGYTHSFYTKWPRGIFGGGFESVNIVFKEGHIPQNLSKVISADKYGCYYMYLIYEDNEHYYIAYQSKDKVTIKSKSQVKSISTEPIRDMRQIMVYREIIPKQNVERIIVTS